ncbi:ubiquitin-conjugating enzyme/RWD-like protein [Piptocephalis cylindrospora]|uniref:Ubiquitin-conjugating enzyme E2 Z n=1 Tax=Piptocephalis cylindrospora TaxID=1907219 RepID=A0A4P9Y1N5_9FUNG|nr:ubiquitin-conjugating enzyme/RWD-like protein [Piptocephalis cylindrospora]|eukprot:RKP12442.1 ubiquitin-conjugating enzyme/RWD-like protein [Piptocephalis cylindrospora]
MSGQATMRLQRELRDCRQSLGNQIFVRWDDRDITRCRALITGPPGTPYAHGFFEFSLKFPPTYPSSPPKVEILTTNGGRTRFNPNLYAQGKVCLSILGTWGGKESEQWSSAHGITSVLISIQSLMSENPYENEPGYGKDEKRPRDESAPELMKAYNLKIAHETIRVSVCGRIEHILGLSKYSILSGATAVSGNSDDGGLAKVFDDQVKRLFLWYVSEYRACVERGRRSVQDGERFRRMPFEMASNIMMGSFAWSNLQTRLNKLSQILLEEPKGWIRESKDWLVRDITSASNLREQYLQVRGGQEGLEGLDVELDEGNPFVWNVTIFGSPMSHYDGGMFKGKMVFHAEFPDILPRFLFYTPIYNPHVTTDGVPYYMVEKEDSVRDHLQALVSLFSSDPMPDPSTHVNKAAAVLYFGNKEERKQYMRNTRRCAARSMEEEY